MSRVFSKNKKELAGVKVVAASDVWVHNPATNKMYKLDPHLSFVGKVDTTMPNIVLKANRKVCL